MDTILSEFGKLNGREKIKGFVLAVVAGVLALIWGAVSPIVNNFIETQTLDFSTFGSLVNITTIGKAAFGTALTYLGVTKYSGEKP